MIKRTRYVLILVFVSSGCTRGLPAAKATQVREPTTAATPVATLAVDGEASEGLTPVEALERDLSRFPFLYSEAETTELALSVVLKVNTARQVSSVPHLEGSSPLMRLASLRAREMVALGYFSHVHPRRGTIEADRLLREEGLSGSVSELLFEGSGSREELAQKAVASWQDDAANREILLSTTYRQVGIGVMGNGDRWIVAALLLGEEPMGGSW